MDKPVNVSFNELGVIGGFRVVEVINADTGESIGYNQIPVEVINTDTGETIGWNQSAPEEN